MTAAAKTAWALMRARAALRDCEPRFDVDAWQLAKIDGDLKYQLRRLRCARWDRAQLEGSDKRRAWMKRAFYAKYGGTLFDPRPMHAALKGVYGGFVEPLPRDRGDA